jgi:hypothetical protein
MATGSAVRVTEWAPIRASVAKLKGLPERVIEGVMAFIGGTTS